MTSVSNLPSGAAFTASGNYPILAPVASEFVKALPPLYMIAREVTGYHLRLKLKEADLLKKEIAGTTDENKKDALEKEYYKIIESGKFWANISGNIEPKGISEQYDDILLIRQSALMGKSDDSVESNDDVPMSKEEQEQKKMDKFQAILKDEIVHTKLQESIDRTLDDVDASDERFTGKLSFLNRILPNTIKSVEEAVASKREFDASSQNIKKTLNVIDLFVRNGFSIDTIGQQLEKLRSEGSISKKTSDVFNDALIVYRVNNVENRYKEIKKTASRKQIKSLELELNKIDLGKLGFFKYKDAYQKKKMLELDIKAQLKHMDELQ